ncbi:hypothetical protein AYL99_06317 [Fonsecaea erecta]|uniref:DUF218 domain-containing protein n=1 Tax=Fonsecaea erecta TaxID=1367422 RepID=A0A178ZGV5_9EURO|nr:hypothetical protein AYL99_06317 [Fonsecaea erecta]OAP59020.1 hypothetical protein AYL99_06317 [Fonsecaea erecta]
MPRPSSAPPSHLIIVCCHAIYLGRRAGVLPDSSAPSEDESNWLIEPFQAGETGTYIQHVEAGVRELARDREHAILVFSGAPTKPDKTPLTEGEGYLNVALEHDLFGFDTSPPSPSLRQRIFIDRYATDSYQNILCSLIQFPLFVQQLQSRRPPQATTIPSPRPPLLSQGGASTLISTTPPEDDGEKQAYYQAIKPTFPTKLTVISHAFKRARFLDLHLPALRFPLESTVYIGINPPFTPAKLAEIAEGDRLRGFGAWEKDLYGAGAGLSRKREQRGWDADRFRREVVARYGGDETWTRQLQGLLSWRGGSDGITLWPGGVPWE